MSETAANAGISTDAPLAEGQVVTGAIFGEPMRVEAVRATGSGVWDVGLSGLKTERFRRVTLTPDQIKGLQIMQPSFSYEGDGQLLRVGLQAYSLGIAYEFDPYFGLSISRVDPLPHQLEAVYDYLLKLARVRFLLADDAGAGKTIMAGLLIRELKLRGLTERVLVGCPASPGWTQLPSITQPHKWKRVVFTFGAEARTVFSSDLSRLSRRW